MPESDPVRKGSCLCGSVTYTATEKMRDVIACHCTQCRKQSGHFYAASDVAKSALHIEGREYLTHYRASADATRSFCKICGSALFWSSEKDDRISVLAGSLDNPSGLKMMRHIFCADKGDYYDIDDGIEQFGANDDAPRL